MTQDDGALDHVGQLPDVAGPRVGPEPLLRLGADGGERLLGLAREAAEEEARELQDVVAALAQAVPCRWLVS
jgi:hypothetical protein